jgi:hypothetical protein
MTAALFNDRDIPAELIVLWSGLGLLGTAIMYARSAEKGKATAFALFSLAHAVIFGPLFLLGALMGSPQQICPHCKSSIRKDATVCPKCTREVS